MFAFPYRMLRAPGERVEMGTGTDEERQKMAHQTVRDQQRAAGEPIDNHQVIIGVCITGVIEPWEFVFVTDEIVCKAPFCRMGDDSMLEIKARAAERNLYEMSAMEDLDHSERAALLACYHAATTHWMGDSTLVEIERYDHIHRYPSEITE